MKNDMEDDLKGLAISSFKVRLEPAAAKRMNSPEGEVRSETCIKKW